MMRSKLICRRLSESENVFDLVVLGAGSGGLAAAKRAASYGAKVAIIEGDRVGGTCVIRGCVPKKLLVIGSHYREYIQDSKSFGVDLLGSSIHTSTLLLNVRKEVDRLNQLHISMLGKSGVHLFSGWGKFVGENIIEVKPKDPLKSSYKICGRKILIAVGSQPVRPNIKGSSLGYVSDDIFLLEKFPKKIVIIGAGYIACEFACIFNNLGVEVIQIVRGDNLLKTFDKEVSNFLRDYMRSSGVKIFFEHEVKELLGSKGDINVITKKDSSINCDATLFAIGRKPFINGLHLDVVNVNSNLGKIIVDKNNMTSNSSIFAVGDVTDKVNLTPVAIEEGRVFADRLFGGITRSVDYQYIPKAVFSQPEIASVGLSESEACDEYGTKNISIYKTSFRPMSQALTKRNRKCFLKLIVDIDSNKVVGCHMAGENAAEIIQMAAIAISMGATKSDFDRTMALHPTIAEEFVTMI